MDRVFGRVNRISQSDFRNQKIMLRIDTFFMGITSVNFGDVLYMDKYQKQSDGNNFHVTGWF